MRPLAPVGEPTHGAGARGDPLRTGPAVDLGGGALEVGPVPVGTPFEQVAVLAAEAEATGVSVLWVRDAPGGGALDALTVAAGLSATTSRLGLGVVAALEGGRSPGVLARDLTALDLLSAGRAAVCLEGDPGALLEAAVVVHRLFGPEPVTFAGAHYELRQAPNRPGPRQRGGPPVLVAIPAAGLLPNDGAPAGFLDALAGWISDRPAGEVGEVRSMLARLGAGDRRPVLWRAPPSAPVPWPRDGAPPDPDRPAAGGIRRLGWPPRLHPPPATTRR